MSEKIAEEEGPIMMKRKDVWVWVTIKDGKPQYKRVEPQPQVRKLTH